MNATYISSAAITILISIAGEVINVGIITASFENLRRQRNAVEFIYFSMGLANMCMQGSMTVMSLMTIFWPRVFYTREVYAGVFTTVTAMTSYNFWLLAWLCVHYCVIISNFQCKVFVWLKGLVSPMLQHFVFISAALLALVGVFSLYGFALFFVHCRGNCTIDSSSKVIQVLGSTYSMIGLYVCGLLPFSLAFISTGMTASSLIIHMWNIKQKLSGSSPPNLQALVSATRTMILFLSLSVIFNIAELLLFSAQSFSSIAGVVSWLVVMSFPIAEAAIIIQASPKIKREFLGRFCAWRPRKTMNTS